jgi:hypothetical protein
VPSRGNGSVEKINLDRASKCAAIRSARYRLGLYSPRSQAADGLVVHAERVGQLAPGDPALGPQDRDPVMDDLTAHIPASRRQCRDS